MKNPFLSGPQARPLTTLLLAAGLSGGPAQAQSPVLTTLTPTPGSGNVGRYDIISAQFAATIGGSSGAGLKVFSRQRGGQRAGTMGPVSVGNNGLFYNPGTLLGPAGNFQAGEVVQVSLTPAVVSAGGTPLAPPAVFEFTTQTDGTGRGNFRPGTDPAAGTNPGPVVVADMDGDSDLDFVTADQGTSSLNVRLNGGNASGGGAGVFSAGTNVAVASGVYGLAVGDVDGDGDLDLVTAEAGTTATLTVLLNNGTGQFSAGVTTQLYNNPTRLVLGDIDGDGDLDLVANSNQQNLVSIRLNDGTGTFDNPPYPGGIGAGGNPIDLALADVDHDRDLDLVLALDAGGQPLLRVQLNGGDATGSNTGLFSGGTAVSLLLRPVALAVGDFNADTYPDVALTGANPGTNASQLAVQFNNGSGTFSSGVYLAGPANPQAVAAGDVDADGDLDLVAAGGDNVGGTPGTLYTVFNAGAAGLDPASARTTVLGNGTLSLALADVDHDGDLDALTGNPSAGTVSVRLNGPFLPPTLRVTLGPPATGTVYASGSTYTFPATAVGSSAPQADFYVTNTGDDVLSLSQPGTGAGTGPAGTQPGLGSNYGGSMGVLPGQSLPLAFFYGVFSPTTAGAGTLQAVFSTNDPARLSFTLTMAGSTAAALPDLVVNTSFQYPVDAGSYTGPYRNVTVTGTGRLYLTADLEVHGAMVVQGGGLLQGVVVANGPCPVVVGPGSFELQDRGALVVCSAAGITPSGATGAVQVSGTRTFSPGGLYTYYNFAAIAQATGAALPAQVRFLSVGSGPLTLSQPVAVKETVQLTLGADLLTASHALTLLSDASGTALLVNQGAGRVVGNATVERYNSSTYRGNGYRHYSAPTSNATVGSLATVGFTPTLNALYNTIGNTVRPFPTVFGYQTRPVFDAGWFAPQALTDGLGVGLGYTVQIAGTETVRFTGPLNQDPQAIGLTSPTTGFRLLGNPFPAPLDWSTMTVGSGPSDNLNNVGAAVYVFEASGPYAGSYRTAVAGVGGSPVIASSQGFFVRVGVVPGLPYSFRLFNRNRVTAFSAADNTFRRPAAETRPLLTLALRDAAGTLPADPASIYFTPAATAGFDAARDAIKLPNTTGLNLASQLGTDDYAINGLPLLGTRPLVLPLSVAVPAPGRYELAVAQLVNFAPGTVLYLRDALLNTLTPLTAATRYAFALAGTSAPGRFAIEFRPAGALATAAQVLAAQVQVWPNPAAGGVFVAVAAPAGATVKVCNALGQAVAAPFAVGATRTAALCTAGLAAGIYVVQVRSAAGTVVTRRLVVE